MDQFSSDASGDAQNIRLGDGFDQSRFMNMRRMYQNISATLAKSEREAATCWLGR